MSSELLSLSGKVALITGSSSGIGKATAVLFAKLGARLALVARDMNGLNDTVAKCQSANKTSHPAGKEPYICISADLADAEQIDSAFSKTMSHFSQLDILVNNAGAMIRDSIETIEQAHLERLMQVNLYAVVQLTRLAVPALTATKGTVVNVSSVCGTRAFPGILSYCMSKAALDQFTKCSALDLAPKGIRVNSVNPGVIITPLQRRSGMTEEEYANFIDRSSVSHALGRPGEVEEVARAIAFLASPASSFTTGDLLSVDGGRSVMCPR